MNRALVLPVRLDELMRMRAKRRGEENRLKIREILNETRFATQGVRLQSRLDFVEVSGHAIDEIRLRFPGYTSGERTPARIVQDIQEIARYGTALRATVPGREEKSDEDRIMTHELPVWDCVQLVIAVKKGRGGLRGTVITVEWTKKGKPPRGSSRNGNGPVASCEAQQAVHSLRAQLAVAQTLQELGRVSAAVNNIASTFHCFQHSSGARGWGFASRDKRGMELVSSITSDTFIDLIMLWRMFGPLLVEHLNRMCTLYRVGTDDGWCDSHDTREIQKSGKLFQVRAFPPDPKMLDTFLLEAMIYREIERTGALE